MRPPSLAFDRRGAGVTPSQRRRREGEAAGVRPRSPIQRRSAVSRAASDTTAVHGSRRNGRVAREGLAKALIGRHSHLISPQEAPRSCGLTTPGLIVVPHRAILCSSYLTVGSHLSRFGRLVVQPSQACTTVWRAIFPPLSSTIAEQNTLVPSGYAQLCVKARRLPTATPFSTL